MLRFMNKMEKTSYFILRIGLAVTFLWIGVLILKEPTAWGGYLQPWAVKLLPVSLDQAMFGTAVLDIVIGVFLLVGYWTWLAALAGALHITIVLVTSGITDITARDIGLLAASLALLMDSLPSALPPGLPRSILEKNKKIL